MKPIEFTDDEADELRATVQATLSELSPEVADTDNAEYRRILRGRRELLTQIVAKLGP